MARFCTNCGSALPQGAAFCPACGSTAAPVAPTAVNAPNVPLSPAPFPSPTPCPVPNAGTPVSRNIFLCQDGRYRWVYELSLLKNPTIFLLVWKIFFFIFLGIFTVVTIADSGRSGFWWEGFLNNLKIFGYILLGMTGVSLLGYLLYAAIMGGKYCVIFEMDDKGVNHKQLPKEAKKAEAISALTMLAGFASRSPGVVGVGMNAARTEMYSEFRTVRKVKAYPSRRLIKISSGIEHNQVYAEPEDFEFVRSFILSHCPKRTPSGSPPLK